MTETAVDLDAHEAWTRWRAGGLGGSDVADVVGLGYGSRWALWADKSGLGQPEPPPDRESRWRFGHDLESILAVRFHERTDLWVAGEQTWCEHPEHDWCRATVDGFVVESPDSGPAGALGVFEAKTDHAGTSVWDEIPPGYQAQGQWQMFVTGLDRVWFGVFHRHRFRTYVLERDDADIRFLFEAATAFWHDHVLTGVPPEVDGSNATKEALNAAWRAEAAAEVDIDHVADALTELRAVKADIKPLEKRRQALENELKAALGEATVGLVDAEPQCTWNEQPKTTIDADALRAAHPAIAAEFTRRTVHRVLRTDPPARKEETPS